MKTRPRILFVAMHHSIHAARWIDTIADAGWSLHLFPLDQDPHHTRLRNITIHRPTLESTNGIHPIGPIHATTPSYFSKISDSAARTFHNVCDWLRGSQNERRTAPDRSADTVKILPF